MKKEVWVVTTYLMVITLVFSITMFNKYANLKDHVEEETKTPHIILLSYIEDGGSFLGDVLQQNQRVFYMYEPLRAIRIATTVGKPISFVNGTEWNSDSFTDVAVDTLRHLTTCDLEKIGVTVWKDEYIRRSRTGRVYLQCYNTLKLKFDDSDAIRYCLEILEQFCKESKGIVSRLSRIPLRDLEPLLMRYSNLKVVHIIPDATDVIQSQIDVNIIQSYNIRRKAFRFCRDMFYNVLVGRVFEEKYPGRILQFYLSDFQKNMIDSVRKIIKFATLEYKSKDISKLRPFEIKRFFRNQLDIYTHNNKNNIPLIRYSKSVCKFWTDKIQHLMQV